MKETEQPTERGAKMRTTRLIAVLVGFAAIAMVTADAHAYYHPGMSRFMSRDPGAGGAHRIGAGGPAVRGGFIPRDPTASNQYADGMNLYQYVGSNPIIGLDPQGEAVVFFGGGFVVPGTDITTGPIHIPIGFRLAKIRIDKMQNEAAFVTGGLENHLTEAKTWLKDLDKTKKCELRIVGYSSGTADALALARDVVKNAKRYGIPDGGLKVIVFYDFNWGAAGHPTYAKPLGGDFSRPKGTFKVHHVVSGAKIGSGIGSGIPIDPPWWWPRPAPMPIKDWTKKVWDQIGFREPTAWEYIWYNFQLANTSGHWTAHYTQQKGGGWLTQTEEKSDVDHFDLGFKTLLGSGEVMGKLFPSNK